MNPTIVAVAAVALVVSLSLAIPFFVGSRPEPVPVAPPAVEQVAPQPPVRTTVDFLQLSSHRTKAEAAAAIRTYRKDLAQIIGGVAMQVYEVAIASGTWFRVVVPTDSRADAAALCVRVKATGRDCLALSFDVVLP